MADQPDQQEGQPNDLDARLAALEQYVTSAEAASQPRESLGGVAIYIPGGHGLVLSNEVLRAGTIGFAAVLLAVLFLFCWRRGATSK